MIAMLTNTAYHPVELDARNPSESDLGDSVESDRAHLLESHVATVDSHQPDPTPVAEKANTNVQTVEASDGNNRRDGVEIVVLGPLWKRLLTWKAASTVLVHLLPLTATASLIAINVQPVFWFEYDIKLGSSPDMLYMLQFVAKVHELLVVGSLAAITLKVYKRSLVGSGLPLGLVTGGYRVGDIPYIVSSPYLKALTGSGCLLALLLLLNTILATLIGPASAILLIPTDDWFPLLGAFDKLDGPIFYASTSNETYPRVLGGEDTDPHLVGCDTAAGLVAYHCPSAGHPEIYNWVSRWQLSQMSDVLTVANPIAATRRRIKINTPWPLLPYATFATTVSMPTLLTITRFLNHINAIQTNTDRGKSKAHSVGAVSDAMSYRVQTLPDLPGVFQPFVQTKCSAFNATGLANIAKSNATRGWFPTHTLSCFGDTDCESALSETFNYTLVLSGDPNTIEVGLYAPRQTRNEARALLGAANLLYFDGKEVRRLVVSCTLMAHWIPAFPVRVSLNASEFVQELSEYEFYPTNDGSAKMIQISSAWLSYLDLRLNATTTPQKNVSGSLNSTSSTITEPTSAIGRLLWPAMRDVVLANGSTVTVFGPGSKTAGGTGLDFGIDFGAAWYDEVPNPVLGGADGMTASSIAFFEKFFSVVVVDGLARVASGYESWAPISSNETTIVAANLGVQQGPAAGNWVYDWRPNANFPNGSVTIGGVGTLPLSANMTQEWLRRRMDDAPKFPLEAERYGYGSGQPSDSMKFALAVMYMYLAVLGVYLLWVVPSFLLRMGRQAKIVAPWEDLQDLLVLAWNSEPNVGLSREVGGAVTIGSWHQGKRIWNLPTAIRAEEESTDGRRRPRVQLVVKGSDSNAATKVLVNNVRYS
ncbi:hypothetical protein B0H63DRAFT_485662 [Podospora didyma]|uniref:Uncharacterized protein n=1 Tax=Podospora didyma TaxID=330526 RepID=A0AAE0K4L7_9PEZI|nr:hypothetical protein B0H63DRAFT_485662 [Podospora didyma]